MTQYKLYFVLILLNLNILTFIIKNKDLGFLKKIFLCGLLNIPYFDFCLKGKKILINEMVPV